jgi:orotidine-5'-phosphate decarboxylase
MTEVNPRSLTIGRGPGNDVVVAALGVSKRHAELRRAPDGRYAIIDLGSHNGTYVNGIRVDQAELAEGDIVSIGHAAFRLSGGELSPYAETGPRTGDDAGGPPTQASANSSFAERFAAARASRGPLVLGADPHAQVLADWGLPDDAGGLERFTDIVLAAAVGTVGLVKPQSAFYERHGWRGIRALTRLAEEARSAGLLVILDVKRGDVGSTNAAYAAAYLGEGAPLRADAVTVHPYLGLDALGEFTRLADQSGGCVLVVVRSSNPEGRLVQSASTDDGLAVEQRLLAGIGAAFAACPDRVMPSASRSLLAAGPDPASLRDAAAALNEEFRALL